VTRPPTWSRCAAAAAPQHPCSPPEECRSPIDSDISADIVTHTHTKRERLLSDKKEDSYLERGTLRGSEGGVVVHRAEQLLNQQHRHLVTRQRTERPRESGNAPEECGASVKSGAGKCLSGGRSTTPEPSASPSPRPLFTTSATTTTPFITITKSPSAGALTPSAEPRGDVAGGGSKRERGEGGGRGGDEEEEDFSVEVAAKSGSSPPRPAGAGDESGVVSASCAASGAKKGWEDWRRAPGGAWL
jgi:hypothetical protein